MGEINFYLKKPKKNGKALVYLKYKFNGQVLVMSMGLSVDPKTWNYERQRVRQTLETLGNSAIVINSTLSHVQLTLERRYNELIIKGTPSKNALKDYLKLEMVTTGHLTLPTTSKPRVTLLELFDQIIAGKYPRKGKMRELSTLKNYHAVKMHLIKYSAAKGTSIHFEDITLHFFEDYITFLRNQRNQKGELLANNTIAKDIRILKAVMRKALDLDLTSCIDFQKTDFSFTETEVDAVYLTESQILELYEFDFSSNRRLENVRDLFVFGCWVGLRFSDFTKIKPENIRQIPNAFGAVDTFLDLITTKTKERVIIPCHPIVLEIFQKYSMSPNSLPPRVSNQKFNKYIKEACMRAGFTQSGALVGSPARALYECISSHTCRRSMATNFYKRNFPVHDLMRITSHKTEKSFLKYIRMSKQETANRLLVLMQTWSDKF